MTDTVSKPEGQPAETPTPEDFVPVGPETVLAMPQFPAWYLQNITASPEALIEAHRDARMMVDRELMEAIYVILRVRP